MDLATGFTANWYYGQNDAGLAVYVSPGTISGIQVLGTVLPVPPDINMVIWVTYLTGFVQIDYNYPTNVTVYPIAQVQSGKIITSTVARNGFFNTDEGIKSIVDARPGVTQLFAFASSNLMGSVSGTSTINANGSLNVPIGAQIQGQGTISALLTDTRAEISATIAGTSVVVVILMGSLQVLAPLASMIQGVGSVQATTFDLSKSHAAIQGQGSVADTMTGKAALASTILGTSVTSRSNLNIFVPIVSSIAGAGSVQAVTFNSSTTHASVQGVGSISDTLKGAGALKSSIQGNNFGTITLVGTLPIAATISGVGSITAVTFNSSASHAAIAGVGSISDTLTGKGAMVAAIHGIGGTTVGTTLSGSLRDFIAGIGSVSATMRVTSSGVMTSAVLGKGTISALGRVVLPLTITSASSLPPDTVNTAYSDTLAGTGGVLPYTWSIFSGALPPGLSLNSSTGVISGTPTVAGNYSFVVQLTDTE